ncbi:MAG: AAA family ATPase [bacterium]
MAELANKDFELDEDIFDEEDDLLEGEGDLDLDLDDDFDLESIELDTEDDLDDSNWSLESEGDAEAFDSLDQGSDADTSSLDYAELSSAELEEDFVEEDDFIEDESDDDLPPMPEDAATTDLSLLTEAVSGAVQASPYNEGEESDFIEDTVLETDHRPIPRINIHVFCETDHISSLMETVSSDRRMRKAHVSIMMGGAKKAAKFYQQETTPNLVILETTSGGQKFLDDLALLAEVCDPSTNVIVTGAVNDIRLYRELISRGISDYLVNPRQPIHLIRSIADIYADPSAPPVGRNMVFMGARGGVGSSTLCHSVAWVLAEEMTSDTVLLDLDLPFGTASLDFEQDPSNGLTEALSAPERLDDVLLERLLQKCTDRLSLFAAPNLLERDYDMPASSYEEVLEIVRQAAPSVMIDMPHIWTAWSRSIVQSADEIVITATPDLSSFRNVKNIVESMKEARVNDAPPILLLNQMSVPKRAEIPVEQFEEALEMEVFATIDWDPVLFGTVSTNAEALTVVDAKAKQSEAVRAIARKLLGQEQAGTRKKAFNLKSLLGKG